MAAARLTPGEIEVKEFLDTMYRSISEHTSVNRVLPPKAYPARTAVQHAQTIAGVLTNGDLIESFCNQNAYADFRHLQQRRKDLQQHGNAAITTQHPDVIAELEQEEDKRRRDKNIKDFKDNEKETLDRQILIDERAMKAKVATLSAFIGTNSTHPSLRTLAHKEADELLDPHPLVNKVMQAPLQYMQETMPQMQRFLLKRTYHVPNVNTVGTLEEAADTITWMLQYLEYSTELIAWEAEEEHGEDDLQPDFRDGRNTFQHRSIEEMTMDMMPADLQDNLNEYQAALEAHHHLDPKRIPVYGPVKLRQLVDRWARTHTRTTANFAGAGAGSGGSSGGAGARSGGAGAGSGGAGAGSGGAPGGHAPHSRAAGRAGGGSAAAGGGAAVAADNRPSRQLVPHSTTTHHAPCIHCRAEKPSPFHTPGDCTYNPINRLPNGDRPLLIHQCFKCGEPSHPGRNQCPATAAVKAAFLLTDAGQRCAFWLSHKVRPDNQWRKRRATLQYTANANHASSATAIAIIDSGTNKTLVGECVPLEDEHPASGAAEGIGGQRLPIIGTGLFRLTPEIAVPAMRVQGLTTALVSETEVLNADAEVAITVAPAPRGQHVKQVTKQQRVLFQARERRGLFQLDQSDQPPSAAVPDTRNLTATIANPQTALAYITQTFTDKHRIFLRMHRNLRHLSRPRMEQLLRTQAMSGLPAAASMIWPPDDWACITCQTAKIRGSAHPAQAPAHHVATHRSSDLYIDIIEMPNGQKGLHVRDGWTGYNTVDIADKKGTAADFVLQRVHGRHVRDKVLGGVMRVHSDIDVSMLTKETRAYFKTEGIQLIPYSISDPQAHGFVERPHADMWAGGRCNISDYKAAGGEDLPMEYYGWALQHAITGMNIVPRGDETQSPYELEHDRKPNYANNRFRSFGEPCVVQILPKPTDKSKPRGIKGRHFGMVEGSDTLHVVKITYRQKAGKMQTRVIVSRTCQSIFDDADVAGLSTGSDVLNESECSAKDLERMTYKLWAGKNDNECKVCKQTGTLLLCSFCPTSVHLGCVGLTAAPDNDYRCTECSAATDGDATEQDGTDQVRNADRCQKKANCTRDNRHRGRCSRDKDEDTTKTEESEGSEDTNQTNTSNCTRRQKIAAIQQRHTTHGAVHPQDEGFYNKEMTHIERRQLVRNTELAHRRAPAAHEKRRNKMQRTAVFQLQAEVKAARQARARGQRTNTDRLRQQIDNIITMPGQARPETTGTTRQDANAHHVHHAEDDNADEQHQPPPAWLQRIGSMQVPIGGGMQEDGTWVNHVQTSNTQPAPHARDVPRPPNYNAAQASEYWPSWSVAIQAELKQLQDRGVFSVVDRKDARGHIVLGMTWSFKVKDEFNDDTGDWTGIKFKARLNVRGDQQKAADINPDHRSSPTADIDSIRLLFATMAGGSGIEFLKYDVIAAFLNAKLDPNGAPIYMHAPQGLQLAPGQMLLLNTNIYGLVEAAYLWFMEAAGTMRQLGWKQGTYDPCIFAWASDTEPSAMVLHVDDGMIGGINVDARYEEIAEIYDMKNLGKSPKQYLGMELTHTKEGHVHIHNTQYVLNLIESWANHPEHPIDVRTVRETKRVPLNPKMNLDDPLATVLSDAPWYHEFVGQITNLTKTRADILVAATQLAQGLQRQTEAHYDACRELLIYLRDAADYGSLYGLQYNSPPNVQAYADTEFGRNRITGRALAGFIIKVKGGPVSQKAHHQGAVTRSTNEAETIAFTDAAAAALKIQHYLEDMGLVSTEPPLIHVDNANVIKSCQNVALTMAARHYLQAHHWGREQYREGRIKLQQVASADNMADMHTKPLSRKKFEQHRRAMGMVSGKMLT